MGKSRLCLQQVRFEDFSGVFFFFFVLLFFFAGVFLISVFSLSVHFLFFPRFLSSSFWLTAIYRTKFFKELLNPKQQPFLPFRGIYSKIIKSDRILEYFLILTRFVGKRNGELCVFLSYSVAYNVNLTYRIRPI